MDRFVKGVTLTPQERAQTLPPSRSAPRSHSCDVKLPDGRMCLVAYRRIGAAAHQFRFYEPLDRQTWSTERLEGGTATVEAKAAELAVIAFRLAQEDERKAMRRAASSHGERRGKPSPAPEMDAKAAGQCAGKYAACVRFQSGRLLRVGPLHDEPEGVVQEIAMGRYCHVRLLGDQRLVVGIGCRSQRLWLEAKFVPRPAAGPPDPAPDPDCGEQDGEPVSSWEAGTDGSDPASNEDLIADGS